MSLVVPVQALSDQTAQVQLGGQPVSVNCYQTLYGLFMDVLVNGQQIIGGVLCHNANRIVRSLYLGFSGDFIWVDTHGTTDPVYTGLGARYQLVYLDETDLADGA